MAAQTSAERSRKHREKLKADGWICVTVMLPPEIARILDEITEKGYSLAAGITAALEHWDESV